MPDDAYPNITTDMIDTDDDIHLTEGLAGIFDLRVLDRMCIAIGRDTLEYVAGLLAVMHGEATAIEGVD